MDYEKINESLQDDKIIKMMQVLGADRYIDKHDCIIFPTICHNVDSETASMKLYYYKDNHFFYCYTSCEGMSIFKFLKNYYETRQIDYNWYEDIYLLVQSCITDRKIEGFVTTAPVKLRDIFTIRKREVELEKYNKGILNVFTKFYTTEWLNDGISAATMDKYNILYSISQNKIIIPHYDINGELIGIRGRALNEDEVQNVGKYAPVQIEKKWYSHKLSMNLYGLNFNKENIKKNGIVYLVESEKAVLQIESFNMDNCAVAVCGSNFNKFQLNILLKNCYPKEIVICFDNEELPKSEKYFNKLYQICKNYNTYCNFSFVYDSEGLLQLKESPTDRGEEVFKRLLEKRIKVR